MNNVYRAVEAGNAQYGVVPVGLDRGCHRAHARPAARRYAGDLRRGSIAHPSEHHVQDGKSRRAEAAVFTRAVPCPVPRMAQPQCRAPAASARRQQRRGRAHGGRRRRVMCRRGGCSRRALWASIAGLEHRGRSEQHYALCRRWRARCRPIWHRQDLDRVFRAEPSGRRARVARTAVAPPASQ